MWGADLFGGPLRVLLAPTLALTTVMECVLVCSLCLLLGAVIGSFGTMCFHCSSNYVSSFLGSTWSLAFQGLVCFCSLAMFSTSGGIQGYSLGRSHKISSIFVQCSIRHDGHRHELYH